MKHDISSGYRTIPLIDKALKILDEVKKLSENREYLFTQSNGERLTSRSFNYWLWKYCRDQEYRSRAVIASAGPLQAGCLQRVCL